MFLASNLENLRKINVFALPKHLVTLGAPLGPPRPKKNISRTPDPPPKRRHQRGCREAARHQRGSKETPERLKRGSKTPERQQRDTREAAERQQDTREAAERFCVRSTEVEQIWDSLWGIVWT